MKCVSCDRTLTAGGASTPMAIGDIELMFADLLGWAETPSGWRCADCASCDSHRMAETAKQGSVRSMTGAVGSEADETPKGHRQ